MKKTIISCFCIANSPSGNPAAIVEEFNGSDTDKQQLATQLNLPVTVFIEYLNQTPIFRFFYPAREMSLCIHGALAAGAILMRQSNKIAIQAITKNQQSLIITQKLKGTVYISVERGNSLPNAISLNDIDQMLNIKSDSILDKELPFCVATIGSPKLLVPLLSYDALASLKPNFDAIKQWSLSNAINGLYIYTRDVRDPAFNFIARNFNPKGGSNEDAATGVAAGALYEALKINTEIQISQGEFISQPSCIKVYGEKNKIFIGGKVRIEK
jgi:PhzF family phenazine biosynthesis protein